MTSLSLSDVIVHKRTMLSFASKDPPSFLEIFLSPFGRVILATRSGDCSKSKWWDLFWCVIAWIFNHFWFMVLCVRNWKLIFRMRIRFCMEYTVQPLCWCCSLHCGLPWQLIFRLFIYIRFACEWNRAFVGVCVSVCTLAVGVLPAAFSLRLHQVERNRSSFFRRCTDTILWWRMCNIGMGSRHGNHRCNARIFLLFVAVVVLVFYF